MTSTGKVVLFGIDGVPHSLMEQLSDSGVMPNFAELRGSGTFGRMRSSIPDVSSVSWSSIITGANPGVHGIFGFTHLIPGTYTLSFPNFKTLKAPAFWKREGDDRRHVIINVPCTYPAIELNGFLVSGFVALDLQRAVTPGSYLSALQEMGYAIDVDAKKAQMSKSLFLKDLFTTLEARAKAYRFLWKEFDWDTFMFVVTGSDRLGHQMWGSFEGEDDPHHEGFLEFFRRVDELIGEISGRLGEGDHLVMMSDHGMETAQARVNLNSVLAEEGFLKLGDKPKASFRNILPCTQAFSMDPGRIYLNMRGKFPKAEVDEHDREGLIRGIMDILTRLEHDGRRVISRVHRREDIYDGPYVEDAPDLVMEPNSGFSLMSNTTPRPAIETDLIEGKHTPEAFIYVDADDGIVPDDPSVEDIVPIMDLLAGGD
jgi:predicted AlkP superfamily phosphohydrolase/phosphomutase